MFNTRVIISYVPEYIIMYVVENVMHKAGTEGSYYYALLKLIA